MAACGCPCHHAARGDQRCASQEGRLFDAFHHAQHAALTMVAVDLEDALEAAVACERCRGTHCPAFTSRRCWERDVPTLTYDPTGDTE